MTTIEKPTKVQKAKAERPPKQPKMTDSAMVDQLGLLNAQISALAKEADKIKDTLKKGGDRIVVGKLYRAAISTSIRSTLSSEKVRAILSEKEIAACTVNTPTTTLSLHGL